MITSFVPLAASVLLTVQHLVCAASCQEGPDFSFRQGGGWGNRRMYTWRGFCQENKAISPAATAAGCLATVLLENNPPFFPLQRVPDGQLVGVSSPSAPFRVRRGQAGHLRSVFPKFPLLVDEMPFSPLLPGFSCFSWGRLAGHPKHSALAWQSVFSLLGQQKQAGAGCHGAPGKIPAHRSVCSHPPYMQQIFGICRISLILCIFVSLKLSLVTRSMTHTNVSHTLHCV